MKIILFLLLSVVAFGQSGKSVLSDAQKDSINAMIGTYLDTAGVSGGVSEDTIKAWISDSLENVTGRTYSLYTCLISQSSTANPIATVLENDIGTIVWTRISTGTYRGTLTDAFEINKTFVSMNSYNLDGATDGYVRWARSGSQNDNITINTYNLSNVLADGVMSYMPLEIRVYPATSGSAADTIWYGVSGLELASVDLTRIGNDMTLHASLPIQSLMKGCVLNDNGTVNYYFDVDDWTYQEDGVTAANRDGTDGQVMVEIPEHYYKDWTDGSTQKTAISLYALSGYTRVPKFYVSAYEATLYRPTDKLSSVATLDTNYRGGYSQDYLSTEAAWDGTDTTMLGKPVYGRIQSYNTPNEDFRTYANNRGVDWFAHTWKAKTVIQRLFMIEYATKNSQKAVEIGLTAEGYKQGGLGNGVTDLTEAKAIAFNERKPIIPCGSSDALANGSGEASYNVPYTPVEAVKIARYRGIENVFGHLWELIEGIVVYTDSSGDGSARAFIIDNTANFTSSDTTNGRYAGNIPYTSSDIVINTISNNDFIPTGASGTDYSAGFTDYIVNVEYYTSLGGIPYNHVRSGGYYTDTSGGERSGLFAIKSGDYYGLLYHYLGTRLNCFPNGY